MRYRLSFATMLFGNEKSFTANPETGKPGCAILVTNGFDHLYEKCNKANEKKWLDGLGDSDKIFFPSFGGDNPKPGDVCCQLSIDHESKSLSVTGVSVDLSCAMSYDAVTREPQIISAKSIRIKVAVYKYKEVVIYNPHDKKPWKATDAAEMFVPLEVLPLMEKLPTGKGEKKYKSSETRYLTCNCSADLIKIIGTDAYMDVVKQVSSHPLYAPLVEAGLPRALGAPDIIFALRALTTKSTVPLSVSSMLADNIFTSAAVSVGKPIQIAHQDKEVEGMSKKDKSKAMGQYESGCDVRRHLTRAPPHTRASQNPARARASREGAPPRKSTAPMPGTPRIRRCARRRTRRYHGCRSRVLRRRLAST